MPSLESKVIFFPYVFGDEELVLRLEDCSLDGAKVSPTWDEVTMVCDLSEFPPWTDGQLIFSVEPAQSVWVDAVIPADERPAAPLALVGGLHCGATFKRWRLQGALDVPAQRGRLIVPLVRADLRQRIDLSVFVIRTTDQGLDPTYAGETAARVMSCKPVSIYVDAPAENPGPGLRIEWESFQGSNNPFRRERASVLFHLDTIGEPTLFLNSDSDPDLCAILKEQAPKGRKAHVRNAIFAAMAMPVWQVLLRAALQAVPEDETESLPNGWQRKVLEHVASVAEPDCDDQEATRRLVRDLKGSLNSIEERIPVVLAELVEFRRKAELVSGVLL